MELAQLLAAALPDRPAALLLSGGLDSALLAALAAERGVLATAFSVDDDEADTAAALAAELRVPHVRVGVEDLARDFVAAVRACGAPIINGRAIASFRLLRAVHEAGLRDVIAGVGADEVFRGHLDDGAAWRATLAQDAAILSRLTGEPFAGPTPESILAGLTLPPVLHVAHALDLHCHLPFLAAPVRAFAATCDLAVHDGLGKWPVRDAARGRVPDAIRLAAKVARLRPADDFHAIYARWLPDVDPQLPERILLALASRAVLSSAAP